MASPRRRFVENNRLFTLKIVAGFRAQMAYIADHCPEQAEKLVEIAAKIDALDKSIREVGGIKPREDHGSGS